jgi:hypothetical protein
MPWIAPLCLGTSGFRVTAAVTYSEEDVAPWDASALSQVSILDLDVELLFHEFAQPLAWIFPAEGEPPKPHLWCPELVTEANIVQLLEAEPWTVLDAPITPVSFDISGWFAWIALKYADLEEEHNKQSFWESAHAFPIDSDLRKQNPYMAEFGRQRKQRRSRLGARWKSLLRVSSRVIAIWISCWIPSSSSIRARAKSELVS